MSYMGSGAQLIRDKAVLILGPQPATMTCEVQIEQFSWFHGLDSAGGVPPIGLCGAVSHFRLCRQLKHLCGALDEARGIGIGFEFVFADFRLEPVPEGFY